MKIEKILKRDDGSKVQINISFYADSFSNKSNYNIRISLCEPKKRTFNFVYGEKQNEVVAPEEIQAVALELWEQMKPSFI